MFHGVWPALTTPFLHDGSIDWTLFHRKVLDQIQAGVHGLILGGTLGEASTLERDEKTALFKAAKAAAGPDFPIAVNIAEPSTRQAISLVRELESLGVDGYMLLPPMRYTSDPAETKTYLEKVITECTKPVMLYNNPVDYKIEITPAMLSQLCAFPQVQAVKESTRDMRNMTKMIDQFGDRLAIMCGVDNIAMESLIMGARGWVAGLVCAFPKETVAIYELVQKGHIEEARAIYRWFLPILDLDVSTKLVQNIKLAEQVVGMGTEHVREPRLPLSGAARHEVLGVIENALTQRPRV